MKLPLRDVVVDPTIQVRDGLNEDALERYGELTTEPPPVVVFGPANILADGFHRYEVARRKNQTAIEADWREGDRDEASEYAAIANLANSEPLSRTERNRAIQRVMDLHPKWAATKIAALTGVSSHTVGNISSARDLRAKLPTDLLNATKPDGKPVLTDTHLYRIATVEPEQREPLARKVVVEGWTEPLLREAVKDILPGDKIGEGEVWHERQPRRPGTPYAVVTALDGAIRDFFTKPVVPTRPETREQFIRLVAVAAAESQDGASPVTGRPFHLMLAAGLRAMAATADELASELEAVKMIEGVR